MGQRCSSRTNSGFDAKEGPEIILEESKSPKFPRDAWEGVIRYLEHAPTKMHAIVAPSPWSEEPENLVMVIKPKTDGPIWRHEESRITDYYDVPNTEMNEVPAPVVPVPDPVPKEEFVWVDEPLLKVEVGLGYRGKP